MNYDEKDEFEEEYYEPKKTRADKISAYRN